ncbi:MAG: DUF6504 family protein [Candidatus Eiseniibacteriota bacterium]
MIEKVQEPIEVLSKFVEGKIQPIRFRWRGRVFTVAEITGTWIKRTGEERAHFFSVGVGTREYYEICFQPRSCQWTLEHVHAEG